MARNNLSSKDVCEIIQACAMHKVAVLKFGDLYLRLGPKASDQKIPTQTPDKAISDAQHDQFTQAGLDQDANTIREEQMAMAMIENPSLYEQMLKDGELDDAADEFGDE